MTDFILLDEKIKDSGMPIAEICRRSGIKKETFYNRLKGKGAFTAPEIVELTRTLRLSNKDRDAIFLCPKG